MMSDAQAEEGSRAEIADQVTEDVDWKRLRQESVLRSSSDQKQEVETTNEFSYTQN